MSVVGNSEVNMNVIPLFSKAGLEVDHLKTLLEEGGHIEQTEAKVVKRARVPESRILVSENQFPDQSILVLNQQLSKLKESMERLKFYISDLDDLLPR